MAIFSLRSQRTGIFKDFSLLEVLKLLGDKVNDEIWLEDDEDVYNLSSFIELNGSSPSNGQSIQWLQEHPVYINGLSQFTLPQQPYNMVVLVYFNGICQKLNIDFTLRNGVIQFPFAMKDQDNLVFFYQSLQ